MSGNGNDILSLVEIKRSYPDQWVAIAVRKTDVDGLPSAGVVLVHDADEQFVWPALKLGEADDLIHVLHTGSRKRITAAALSSAEREGQGQKSERKGRRSKRKGQGEWGKTLPLALRSLLRALSS